MSIKLNLQKSANKYSFAEENIICLGSMFLRIPTLHKFGITERVNVPHANISFLVGLDLLDKYGLHINNIHNILYCPRLNLEVPLERKRGYIYLLWDNDSTVLYTRPDFVKFHETFSHPASHKFFKLLKLVRR